MAAINSLRSDTCLCSYKYTSNEKMIRSFGVCYKNALQGGVLSMFMFALSWIVFQYWFECSAAPKNDVIDGSERFTK